MERLETAEKQLAESNSALNREDWSSKPAIGHLLPRVHICRSNGPKITVLHINWISSNNLLLMNKKNQKSWQCNFSLPILNKIIA